MKLKLITVFIFIPLAIFALSELDRLQRRYARSAGIEKVRLANQIADYFLETDSDSALHYSGLVLRTAVTSDIGMYEARAAIISAKAYRMQQKYTEANNVLETRFDLLRQSDTLYTEALDITAKNYKQLSDYSGLEKALKKLLVQVKKQARKDDNIDPVIDVMLRLIEVKGLDKEEARTYIEIIGKISEIKNPTYRQFQDIESRCLIQLEQIRDEERRKELARKKILRDAETKKIFEQRGDSLESALGKVRSTLFQLQKAREREAAAKQQDSITRLRNDSLEEANMTAKMERMLKEKELDSIAAESAKKEIAAQKNAREFERKRNMIFALVAVLGFFVIFFLMKNKWHKQNEQKLNEKNKQLEEARKAAEAANIAKSEFLANTSHEIRTPLNAILGFSELLASNVDDPKNKGYLESITVSGKNLLNIINDILDLSKIEAGRMDLECSRTNLNKMLEEIESIFSIKAKEKNLEFTIDTSDADKVMFRVDEVRLRQVLINLTGNAMKFTDEGGITLRYRTENLDSDKQTGDLIISVEDTGIGIPENQLQEIFAAFKQKSGQNTKKYGGTGLGLAISKRLINIMDGDLIVKSKLGVGSIFIIKLTNIEYTTDMAESENATRLIDTDKIFFEPAVVLVTDDIDDNRRLLKEYMAGCNFTVHEAENGLQAVSQTEKHKPDIILMDLRMPEMDGYAAFESIRNNEATKDIPIIAQTASVMKKDRDEIFKFGFDSFLEKPASKTRLFEELMRFLPYSVIEKEIAVEEKHETPNKGEKVKLGKKAKENIDFIISELEEKYQPALADLAKTLRVRQIRELTGEMSEFARKYEIEILEHYIENLENAINSFNRNNIKAGIEEFESLIERIREVA